MEAPERLGLPRELRVQSQPPTAVLYCGSIYEIQERVMRAKTRQMVMSVTRSMRLSHRSADSALRAIFATRTVALEHCCQRLLYSL